MDLNLLYRCSNVSQHELVHGGTRTTAEREPWTDREVQALMALVKFFAFLFTSLPPPVMKKQEEILKNRKGQLLQFFAEYMSYRFLKPFRLTRVARKVNDLLEKMNGVGQ